MYIRVTATIAFLIHLFIVEPTHAAAPELTRADAQKILAAQGYNDISVVALLQGMGGIGIGVFSNPNVSFVLYAYNYRNKKTKKDEPIAAEQSMYFDPDLGWFHSRKQKGIFHIYTTSGKQTLPVKE